MLLWVGGRCGDIEECAGRRDVVGAVGAGEEPVVADAVEARGQHVQQKAPDELVRVKPHRLPAARTVDAIVFPAERDARVVGCDEAAVGDGDTAGVTGKIAQHLLRSRERRLAIAHLRHHLAEQQKPDRRLERAREQFRRIMAEFAHFRVGDGENLGEISREAAGFSGVRGETGSTMGSLGAPPLPHAAIAALVGDLPAGDRGEDVVERRLRTNPRLQLGLARTGEELRADMLPRPTGRIHGSLLLVLGKKQQNIFERKPPTRGKSPQTRETGPGSSSQLRPKSLTILRTVR